MLLKNAQGTGNLICCTCSLFLVASEHLQLLLQVTHVEELAQVVTWRCQQPVAILVPFHFHYSVLVSVPGRTKQFKTASKRLLMPRHHFQFRHLQSPILSHTSHYFLIMCYYFYISWLRCCNWGITDDHDKWLTAWPNSVLSLGPRIWWAVGCPCCRTPLGPWWDASQHTSHLHRDLGIKRARQAAVADLLYVGQAQAQNSFKQLHPDVWNKKPNDKGDAHTWQCSAALLVDEFV